MQFVIRVSVETVTEQCPGPSPFPAAIMMALPLILKALGIEFSQEPDTKDPPPGSPEPPETPFGV